MLVLVLGEGVSGDSPLLVVSLVTGMSSRMKWYSAAGRQAEMNGCVRKNAS